ncbi:MAG: DUF4062 domain-containing protein [Prevotellaceae bacterium]|jgi:predicted HTH transcriptional regulator|nr:DUF4062 domain-containing protein [Prevotellaceae bacterium]
MQKKRVFISSVQSEFVEERQILNDYLTTDALLGRFFEPFIFENVPALNASAVTVFLNEVEQCDIYLGIFGEKYGFEDADGISPTEREFDFATQKDKIRFVYVKQSENRNKKENLLIKKAENVIVRRSFATPEQLKTAVYASLVNYLLENEYIRTTPFDATLNTEAAFTDIDEEKVRNFAEIANEKRDFPFDRTTDPRRVLAHLNLTKGERITNAAILLFGKQPQRFFITSEVKCAHYHGVRVSKPIPSYQVYKGDVFEMIDKAVDFVLSKINLYVGDRSESVTVDVEYEMPKQAVREAIVNAVCHRDYTSNGSVQVMLFADRLEVSNPGHLPYGLTVEQLYFIHNSIPANPLLAEPMYLRGTIERMGTGTEDMATLCVEKGLQKPLYQQQLDFRVVLYRNTEQIENVENQNNNNIAEQVSDTVDTQVSTQVSTQVNTQVSTQVDTQIEKLIMSFNDDVLSINDLIKTLNLKERRTFARNYIQPALRLGLIEMTIPDKPNSRLQKYRLTKKGIKFKRKIGHSFRIPK